MKLLLSLMRRLDPQGTKKKKRPIPLYANEADRDRLRAAGRFNAGVLDHLRPHVRPGVTTGELDRMALAYIVGHGHQSATIGYQGYRHALCTSVNECVCHGVPSDDVTLREGDIVNIDCTTIVDGMHGDSSETFMVGEVSDKARALVQHTHDALWLAINTVTPGCSVIEIGYAISRFARKLRLGVVEKYQGHGVGREFHQGPDVPHFPHPTSRRDLLRPGTCFTIEPMLNLGGKDTDLPGEDGWTVLTRDRSLSAQFEHTVLMTEDGPEPLTLTQDGPQEGHVF